MGPSPAKHPDILGIIPARYASTRFPGKPLARIHGRSMILRVCDIAARVLQHFVVATDDERIYEETASGGYRAVMTRRDHPNGTSRCLEAYRLMNGEGFTFSGFINLQGDEPLLDPANIGLLADSILDADDRITTLVHRSYDHEWYHNPNRVKVVCDQQGDAMYFSRAPIPHFREKDQFSVEGCLIHAGIYGFSSRMSDRLQNLSPVDAENHESLEQLRWLAHGIRVHCLEIERLYPGIDTPDDLESILRYF